MKTSTTDKDKLKEGYEKFDFYYILIKYIQLLNPIFIYKSIHVKHSQLFPRHFLTSGVYTFIYKPQKSIPIRIIKNYKNPVYIQIITSIYTGF